MGIKCQSIMQLMENLAPVCLAEEWDNVGLLLGDPGQEVNSILVSLDVTGQVVDEAIKEGADLIVAHHPLIFTPLRTLRSDQPQGALVTRLVQQGIMIYVAHTNLDNAERGVNHLLAQKLGLEETRILKETHQEKLFKVVVFVPQDYLVAVRDAMGDAGAGWIGNYSHCTFRTAGTGTFKALEGANPFIGSQGTLEEVDEYRLETIVSKSLLQPVITAMIKAHPYEEVAYDIYPVVQAGKVSGLGRVGKLLKAVSLEHFAYMVKEALNAPGLRVAGEPAKQVQTVAVCGGAGAGLVQQAVLSGAQVLVTADVKYHQVQEAQSLGLAVIDAGHAVTERLVVDFLGQYLREELARVQHEVKIITSQVNTEPWQYY